MQYVFKAILIKAVSWALIVCLTHNPVAVFYMATGLLFFRPLPAIADAFLDRAAEGQDFGTELMTGFSIPSVNSSTGETTLNNGLAAGEKIQQNGLFQEIQPGSMDGIAASYGDAATFGTQVNNGLGALSTGGSTHAQAYQTLMGANTSMPNLYNDPLWKQSDDVYTRTSPLIDDLFNGCEKKTSFSEKSCPVHLEDLKTCKKTLKSESCTVTRVITELTGNQKAINKVSASSADNSSEVVFNDLTSNINIQLGIPWNHDAGSSGCYFWEYTIVIHVNDPSRLISALMTYVAADGGMSLFIDDSQRWDGNGGYASCPDGSWDSTPNFDILPYLTQGQHTLTMRIAADNNDTPSIPDGGASFVIKKKPDFKEDFQDFPAGCRARIFAAWPPDGSAPAFVSTGSLADQASTDWWQCTDAATSRTVGTTVITNTPDIAHYLAPILPDPPATPPAPICYKAETRVPGHITLPCFTDKDGYQVCPEYDYKLDEHNSCDTLTANPQCAYVGESCAEGAISPVTGSCQEFIVTYDCGTDHQASCAQVNDGEKTICDSAIRCMGGECVDQPTESNKDFIKAATALQTLNQAQQSNGCSATTGDCALFAGERMECQMADLSVLGAVDCCNMPIAGSWIDYMMLAANTWELADTSVEAYAMAEYGGGYMTADFGAWNLVASDTVFSAPIGAITDTWNAITEPFTSMYDSVASMLSEQIGTDLVQSVTNTPDYYLNH